MRGSQAPAPARGAGTSFSSSNSSCAPSQADLRLEQIAIQSRQEQITIRLQRPLPPLACLLELCRDRVEHREVVLDQATQPRVFLRRTPVEPRIDSAHFLVLSPLRSPASVGVLLRPTWMGQGCWWRGVVLTLTRARLPPRRTGASCNLPSSAHLIGPRNTMTREASVDLDRLSTTAKQDAQECRTTRSRRRFPFFPFRVFSVFRGQKSGFDCLLRSVFKIRGSARPATLRSPAPGNAACPAARRRVLRPRHRLSAPGTPRPSAPRSSP